MFELIAIPEIGKLKKAVSLIAKITKADKESPELKEIIDDFDKGILSLEKFNKTGKF